MIGGDPYLRKGYRLPMEAEWEYAARAGTKTAYYNGDDASKFYQIAWYNEDWNSGSTHPVGKKEANLWGLYDMSGNVWEWCWDWFKADYYDSSPTNDPTGPAFGSYRILRGGSWNSTASGVRSGVRIGYYSGTRSRIVGFRLVRLAL